MKTEVLQALVLWRKEAARKEGIRELYRIFSNATLEELARKEPQDEYELLTIKGIGEKKCERYGKEILSLIRNAAHEDESAHFNSSLPPENFSEKTESVGEFLDRLNLSLSSRGGRVRGEVTSFQWRNTCVYFSLKDSHNEAVLSCFMWAKDLMLFGVELHEGMDVVVNGFPPVYKPSGKMNFNVSDIELVGEGALKASYEALKKKLEIEGMFDVEQKKKIPEFPQRIGIITSLQGAVIHDFLNNISRHEFHFLCADTRVEGQLAVRDLLHSLRQFRKKPLDVLVIMRGGGSMESLQAFNNEALVREIRTLPFPVIAAIGHHQDVPLLSLVADKAVSTPTAAAHILGEGWEKAKSRLEDMHHAVYSQFIAVLRKENLILDRHQRVIEISVSAIVEQLSLSRQAFSKCTFLLDSRIREIGKNIYTQKKNILSFFYLCIKNNAENIHRIEKSLFFHSPERMLQLGYCLVRKKKGIIRSVRNVSKDEELEITLSDGKIISQVTCTKYEGKQ